ncbi:carboxylesterase family protein [Pleomorphovibrio marinus]|uniref:carboxylesterase family protein n=1 Tax=Pleomorphovibrio marinus TaxID=2164132 RepID=UPI000E0B74F1|nr:alpha/beta hydrolase-fold protein [Pleomorphovibrio marinus]
MLRKFVFTLPLFWCLIQVNGVLSQRLSEGPQVLSFHSEADDTDQPYAIFLPGDFDETKRYPLVIMLHGAGSNHRLALKRVFGKSNEGDETDVEASRYFQEWESVDYIVAAPYARGTAGYQGIPEQDVYAVLDDVKERFTIDENRIYLTGLSMGGGGTLWLGLTKPDIWAAIAPVCPAPPQGSQELAPNAQHLPVHFFHGDADPVVPISGTRDWVDRLQQLGVQVYLEEYEGVAHDSWENAYDGGRIFEWLGQFERNPYPDKVHHVAKHLKYGKAFWVAISSIAPGETATIKVSFAEDGVLQAECDGIFAFELDLTGHPKSKDEMKLNIEGKELAFRSGDPTLVSKDGAGNWAIGKDKPQNRTKRVGQEGPVYDAFSSRHVYVYGTSDDPGDEILESRKRLAEEAAYWSRYRGEFLGRIMFFPRVLADNQVRKSDMEEANLILFGDASSNSIIKNMEDKLPMKLKDESGKKGLLYVYPKEKGYVVINEGAAWWEIDKAQGYRFLSPIHQNLSQFKDFQLYDTENGEMLHEGYFDNNWKIQEEDKDSLSELGILSY